MGTDRFRILLEAQPLLWVLGEEALDEVFELLRRVLGEANDPLADDVVELSLGVGIVRRTAHVELVEHNAELVPVYHAVVAPLVDDLKRKIGGRAAEGLVEGVQVVCLFGEAEVSQKGVSVFVEHDVIRF